MKLQLLFIICTALLLPLHTLSQTSISSDKPKIGLVLSGGGAKGLAHIGVLKVLEEAGITPDYITGTSMGSIIGALYAMGYSADEISHLNHTTDWTKLLSDQLPLNKIVMEEKYESDRYLFSFPIRNYEFKLPSGFIEGQQLESLFAELTWPLPQNFSFDSLPIPFRCYSVDLISGQTYEHKSGDLTQAIRASMAIPSVFSPESIDSMLLVDGGVALNFPVQQVKDMGADIIIGVYVGTEEDVTKEDLFSFSDVLGHTIFIGGIIDSKRQIELVDVLIEPDLKGLGSADFFESELIEQYGRETAQMISGELKKLADSLNRTHTIVEKIEKIDSIKVGEFKVENLRFLKPDFVIGNSGLKVGKAYNQQDIARAVERLYGTKYFTKVTYKLEKRTNDYVLIFNAIEKTRAFLKLSPNYDSDRGIGLVTNLTLRNWGINSSHFIFSVNIAENPAIRMNLTKYWGRKQRVMNDYYINANMDNLPFYNNGTSYGEYEWINWEFGIGFKYSIGLNHQFRLNAFYETNGIIPDDNLKKLNESSAFDRYSVEGFGAGLHYANYSIDDLYFPTEGRKLLLAHKYVFKPKVDINYADTITLPRFYVSEDQKAFQTVFFHYSHYRTLFNRLTVSVETQAGISSDDIGVSGYYLLGGAHTDKRINYVSMAGFGFGEIMAKNFSSLHGNFRIKIIDQLYFAVNSNIALHAQTINNMADFIVNSSFNDYFLGYNVGIQFDSPLGPMQFMVGDNNKDGNVRWYISMGYPF